MRGTMYIVICDWSGDAAMRRRAEEKRESLPMMRRMRGDESHDQSRRRWLRVERSLGRHGRARVWSWDTHDLTQRPDDDAREERVIFQGTIDDGVETGAAKCCRVVTGNRKFCLLCLSVH